MKDATIIVSSHMTLILVSTCAHIAELVHSMKGASHETQ